MLRDKTTVSKNRIRFIPGRSILEPVFRARQLIERRKRKKRLRYHKRNDTEGAKM